MLLHVRKICKSTAEFDLGGSVYVIVNNSKLVDVITLKINSRYNTDHNFHCFQKISDFVDTKVPSKISAALSCPTT